MKKIKYLIYFVVIVSLILVLAGLFAPSFIDFNKQRDNINQLISSQLNRPVQIDGDIALQFVPRPYLKIADLRVLPFDGETDVLKVSAIEAEFSLQKLLMGQLVFTSIRIDQPRLTFMVTAEGVESWTPKRVARGKSFNPSNMRPITSLGKVTVNDLTVVYDNQQLGRARELRNGQLNIDGINLSSVVFELQGMLDSLPVRWGANLNLTALQEIRGQSSLGLGPLEVLADGRLADAFDEPLFDGTLAMKGSQPLVTLGRLGIILPLMSDMPIDEVDHKARTYVSNKMLRLENVVTTFNDTQVTGSFEMRFGADSNDIVAAARVDRIDLDRYFPKKEDAAGERWSSQMIDLRPMQSKGLKLDLQAGEVSFRDYVLRDFALKGENIKGIATLESLNFNLAGGTYRSNGRMDIGTSSRMRYTGKIDGVSFDALVNKPDSYVDGLVMADFDFNFGGSSVKDFMSSLTGQINLSIPNGTLRGVRIEDLSLALNSMFDGKTQGADSPFSGLTARLFMENGVIRNDNFKMKSGEIELLGNGKIDVLNGTINYRLRPVLNDKLGSVVLPVTLRGSLERPQVIPDLLTAPTAPAADAMMQDDSGAQPATDAAPTQPVVAPQQGRVDLPFNFGDDQNLRDNVLKFLEKNE